MAEGLSRKQIEMLLGGYAAGTLTPAEQQALFAAALEDQSLFDALAHEEALRELLADPATRAELRAVVEPRRASWWTWLRNPAFGGLAIGVAVATLLLVFVLRPRHTATPSPQKPVEMAENRQAPAPPVVATPPAPQRHAVKPRQFEPPPAAPPTEPEAPAPLPPPPSVAAESAAAAGAKSEAPPLAAPAPPNPVTSFRDTTPADHAARMEAAAPARAKSRRMAAPGFQGIAGYLDRPDFAVTIQRNDADTDNAVPFAIEDRIRLAVAIHTRGYLYAFERRGDAEWQRIFPTDAEAARVEPGATYRIPVAATEPGKLTVRVVFSPRPLDLDAPPNFRLLTYRDTVLEFR